MMGALYTTYNVVNNTYSQVSEKAKISRSSRDLVSMLMRDIRMAGFKYYAGSQTIAKFAEDTNKKRSCNPGLVLPNKSYLTFDNGFNDHKLSHNPIVIRKNRLGFQTSSDDSDSIKSKANSTNTLTVRDSPVPITTSSGHSCCIIFHMTSTYSGA